VLLDLPDPQHDPERVRDLADEILSRPQYRWDDRHRSILDRIGDWLADQLGRLAAPFGVSAVPVWLGWIVLALLVGLVVALVYRSRTGRRRRPRPGRDPSDRVVISQADVEVDWAAEADRNEDAGRWRDGLRCRYRALVGELATRGVVGDLVGRTAGELAREVAANRPGAAEPFASATELFESAWYGGRGVGPTERDRFARVAERVLAVVDAGRRPVATDRPAVAS
jgi:hypothetical protein